MYFLTLSSDQMSNKQNLHTKFFAKNKLVESTDHETGLTDAALREVSIENTYKAESINSKMLGSRSFCGSCMIPVTEGQARIFRLC